MKSKIDKFMVSFFMPVYIIFIVIYFGLEYLFAGQRMIAFQLWYQVTTLIWLVLAITAIVLLVKVCKLNNLKREIGKWKE